MLVWYLLLGIHIIVYSCTGCSTSKICLCLEDNRLSFSRMSLKSENTGTRPQTAVLFGLQNICFSENKNLTSNSWRWTNLYLTFNSWRWTNLHLALDSWRWTNLYNLFRNSLLVPRILHLRCPPYAPVYGTENLKSDKNLSYWTK